MLSLDQFLDTVQAARAVGDGRTLAVPVARRRSADLVTPVGAFLALRDGQPGRFAFLLESVEGGEQLGRYSFLGRDPYLVVEARGERVRMSTAGGMASGDGAPPEVEEIEGSIFDVLASAVGTVRQVDPPSGTEALPPFTSGAVGFIGYDAVRLVETLPDPPPDPHDLPDAVWAFYDTIAAFDHVKSQLVTIATAFVSPDQDPEAAYEDALVRLDLVEDDLALGGAPGEPVVLGEDLFASNTSQADFEEAVRTAQQHIRDGDIFQVVLSQRFQARFRGDPFNLYRALRQVNPSPYLFYLDWNALSADGRSEQPFQLAGSSPEVLVRVEREDGRRRAHLLPIAGTRPRGATPDEDAALADELEADPKERAEHLMLVDLGRNDLGRVCEPGSVEVEQYAAVERYSHVMHLVSRVAGEVADRATALDVLAACFPAGTVSGAPKVRAMELIAALEPEKRGPYAGAVGYLDFAGNADTCIAIRTMTIQNGLASVQAGAGIVADSDPAAEYAETHAKARALRRALTVAAESLL